jgi:NAD(P)-dependent dehydrogenase (short-subunit alcohol dehydrogenase family)
MELLSGSVVVVSGVGPGLGRSIALASAREGADPVLAAGLRKLPEPGEVAGAGVFLASSMARPIISQCLDVNSGEYHHRP